MRLTIKVSRNICGLCRRYVQGGHLHREDQQAINKQLIKDRLSMESCVLP